jgi:hypothetical protein
MLGTLKLPTNAKSWFWMEGAPKVGVNFINIILAIFYTNIIYCVHVTKKKLPKQHWHKKICLYNVDEIDYR